MAKKKPPQQDEPQPAAKKRADFLPGKEPAKPQEDPFCEPARPIVVLQNRAMVGQVVCDAGIRLAEVRLAKGVTLEQLCTAIRLGQAGPRPG